VDTAFNRPIRGSIISYLILAASAASYFPDAPYQGLKEYEPISISITMTVVSYLSTSMQDAEMFDSGL